MKELYGDLMDYTEGIIAHQVNCRNDIGAGVSGAIISKYPEAETAYRKEFERHENPDTLLGNVQLVRINDKLTVANLFTQLDCGNAAVTGKVYTNVDMLVAGLTYLCKAFPGRKVYIPGYIGCGLAGADWNEIKAKIRHLPLNVVYFLDKEKFKQKCYEAYQLDWMISHGHSLSELFNIIKDNLLNTAEYDFPKNKGMLADIIEGSREHFLYENGFNGSLYVCKDEFLLTEFLDQGYMIHLLRMMPEFETNKRIWESIIKEENNNE